MKISTRALTALIILSALPELLHAADVSAVGSTSGTGFITGEASDWRTPATMKSLDSDGDNIYGTAGYFTVDGSGGAGGRQGVGTADRPIDEAQVTGLSTATLGANLIAGNFSGFDDYDDVNNAGSKRNGVFFGTDFGANSASGGLQTILSYTVQDATQFADGLRIGVLLDVSNGESGGVDSRGIADEIGILINGIDLATTTPAAHDGFLDAYFFDLTNLADGDTIAIQGASTTAGTTFNVNGISGVTFDPLVAVPEPSSIALWIFIGTACAIGCLWRRLAVGRGM